MNDLTIKIHRMISVLNKRHHRFISIDLLSCTEEFHRDPLCLFLFKHFNRDITIIVRISFLSRGQTKAHQSLYHYRDQ